MKMKNLFYMITVIALGYLAYSQLDWSQSIASISPSNQLEKIARVLDKSMDDKLTSHKKHSKESWHQLEVRFNARVADLEKQIATLNEVLQSRSDTVEVNTVSRVNGFSDGAVKHIGLQALPVESQNVVAQNHDYIEDKQAVLRALSDRMTMTALEAVVKDK